jgi:hypothetical protein
MKIKHQDRSSAEHRGRELLEAFGVGSRWVTNEEAAALGDLLALYEDDNGSRCRAYLSWAQHAGAKIA